MRPIEQHGTDNGPGGGFATPPDLPAKEKDLLTDSSPGPAADELRSGTLPDASVDWLKTNFFKTELELGRCLRLPAEGSCECDLYLTCAKFVTTPEYAPRLRAWREVELALARNAAERGWDRRGRTPLLHERTHRKDSWPT
ncbi:hypothetical protein ABZ567_31670 [Streptomyces sp. NPDC016459]|uniref:hypothetical protein n=1 Tax=Streptomyces sp. NPDC016459 TaxID=3157190 RepID=UPI0033C4C310